MRDLREKCSPRSTGGGDNHDIDRCVFPPNDGQTPRLRAGTAIGRSTKSREGSEFLGEGQTAGDLEDWSRKLIWGDKEPGNGYPDRETNPTGHQDLLFNVLLNAKDRSSYPWPSMIRSSVMGSVRRVTLASRVGNVYPETIHSGKKKCEASDRCFN